MALVIPTSHALVSIEVRSDYDPDSWFTTFGVNGTDFLDSLEVMSVACSTAFELGFQGLLSNECIIVGAHIAYNGTGPDPIRVMVQRNNRGSSSSDKLPQNCAALLRKGTGRGGRSGRGRMFLPGILQESKVSQTGIIANDHLTAIQEGADEFFTQLESGVPGVGSGPLPMVLFHNEGAPGGDDPTDVSSLIVDPKISTQRRRLR